MDLQIVNTASGDSSVTAEVNKYNQLSCRCVGVSAIHEATINGDAYAWNALSSDLDATDCALMVRNLSQSRLLVINRIYVWADIPTAIEVALTQSATAYSAGGVGAAVTGVNLNTSSNKVADAGAYSDDASVAQGTVICTFENNETTGDEFGIDYSTDDKIILGTNGCIGVDITAEIGAAGFECTIIGYFIDA